METVPSTIQTYRDFLRSLFLERQKANPRFSLRAFARAAGLQPSFISMVFSGKRDISEATACDIAEKLSLSEPQAKRLKLLVRYDKASTPLQKNDALTELQKLDPELGGRRDLAVDHFQVISEWYHLPLRLLTDLAGFDWSEERAARSLGITIEQVRQALERMTALELIEWKPGVKPKRVSGNLNVYSPFRNDGLRKYHRQMLGKIADALETQDFETRYTGTMNLCLSTAQIKEAREELAACEKRIASIANRPARKKTLYHLNINLIHLLKPLKEDL